MSDFYIKLPSNGSKQEYPKNKANSFKIRLPEPIRLGPDWKVGLTSISLPDTNGVLPKFTLNDEPLFTMQWFLTRMITIPSNSTAVTSREENFTSQNLSVNFGGLDGVGFMKIIVNFCKTQRLIHGNANKDDYRGFYLVSNPFDLKAEKNLSNKIKFGINKHLCHQMKWILKNDDDDTYQLGPNLKMEMDGVEIPNPERRGIYEDLQTSDGEAVFFLANDEYYFFSIHTTGDS